MEQPNPYIYSKPVVGDQFYDRLEVIDYFLNETNIDSYLKHPDENILVLGLRRMGKTSVLRQINHLLESEGSYNEKILSVYLDSTSMPTDQRDFLRWLTQKLGEVKKLKNMFKDLSKPTSFGNIKELLDQLGSALLKRKIALVLLWDEIERVLAMEENGAVICNFLISSLRGNEYLRIVATSSPFVYSSNTPSWFKRFIELFTVRHYIGNFNDEDALKLCLLNQPESKLPVPRKIAQKIVKITGGHPSYIQKLSAAYLQEGENLNTAINQIKEDNYEFILFKYDFDRLRPDEQQILLFLSEKKTTSKRLAQQTHLKVTKVGKYLEFLLALGYVNNRGQTWEIGNEFFKDWLSVKIKASRSRKYRGKLSDLLKSLEADNFDKASQIISKDYKLFTKALETIDLNSFTFWIDFSKWLYSEGSSMKRFYTIERIYKKILKLKIPIQIEFLLYYNYANLLWQNLDLPKAAATCYEKIFKLDLSFLPQKELARIHFNYADLLWGELREHKKAEEQYKLALGIDSDDQKKN